MTASSKQVSVRRATEDDAETIAELSGDLGYASNAPVTRIRIHSLLQSAADLLLVATDPSGNVVGWLQAHASLIVESGFRVEIAGLIVSPAFRRRGVGQTLVAAAEQWARTLSAETIVVRSNVQRIESHSFYPALGYTCTKTQKVYRKTLVDA